MSTTTHNRLQWRQSSDESEFAMETIKLKTRIDNTGTLRLELPTDLANHEVEVLVVLQPSPQSTSETLGWPNEFFETIDAIEADDLVERPKQGHFEEREPLE